MEKHDIKELIFLSLEIQEVTFDFSNELIKCPTWDSIGQLTLIANVKQKFSITVNIKELQQLITFNDLLLFLHNKVKI